MCGRFTFTTAGELVAEAFGLDETPELRPRYNIAPTQPISIVRRRHRDGRRVLEERRWGLIPRGVTPARGAPPLINARSETVGERPAFRSAFRYRRCVVPADGFFEWQQEGRLKQPFHIRLASEAPFAMAAIWEPGDPEGSGTSASCAVLTTQANELMSRIHDRMPVLLPAAALELWLDNDRRDLSPLVSLLVPYTAEEMTVKRVDRRVNDVRNDDPECLAEPKGQRSLFDSSMLE